MKSRILSTRTRRARSFTAGRVSSLLLCNGSREDTNTMVTVYCSTGRPLDWNPQLSAETGRPVPVDGVYDFSNYPLTGAAP